MTQDVPAKYRRETLDYVAGRSLLIRQVANRLGISSTALVGVLAEEYDDVVKGGIIKIIGNRDFDVWAETETIFGPPRTHAQIAADYSAWADTDENGVRVAAEVTTLAAQFSRSPFVGKIRHLQVCNREKLNIGYFLVKPCEVVPFE